MNWVTLDDVKHHLRYDDDANDRILKMYIDAAEAAINNYINKDLPSAGFGDIRIAALMLVGYFDDNRNAGQDTPLNGNYLPQPVVTMLYPYRKPTAV